MGKKKNPKVLIIGGGFGGLRAAKRLAGKPVDVTIIDKKNYHTFQPLLYQVASSVLSPGEIASPIRRILYKAKNIEVVLGEVESVDTQSQSLKLSSGSSLKFDYLISAAGATHSYFGHSEWERSAPGLKTIDDAVEIRRRVLLAFELAERDAILNKRQDPLAFVVVGGGPTGVELAGAIAGIAQVALARDFKSIDTRKAKVFLFEGSDRILPTFSKDLSARAKNDLESLGVTVSLNTFVTDIESGRVKAGGKWIDTEVAIWATGVAASPIGKDLVANTDKSGRVPVQPDLSIPNHENIFVIGDMALVSQDDGQIVPGVAPAATQMADCATKNILASINGNERSAFKYKDKGSMATIGRNRAVVEIGKFHLTGFFAWAIWLFVHVFALVGFRNRFAVISGWFWAYISRERNARLITGDADDLYDALVFLEAEESIKVPEKKP